MPKWKSGGAFAVRFLNEGKQLRLSDVFVSQEGVQSTNDGYRIVWSNLEDGDGWLIIIAKPGQLTVGHHECKSGVLAMGLALGKDIALDAPAAAWSRNGDGGCELDIYAGINPGAGDIQGKFSGKLVQNNKDAFFRVESGYLYVRKALGQGAPPRKKGMVTPW